MGDVAEPEVLLVEDDDDNREIMADLLVEAGCRVTAVSNGTDALREIERGSADVVVTDMGLPGRGGLELARAARGRMPVVLVTGHARYEGMEGLEDGLVEAVLVKPFEPEQLVAAVRSAAAGRGR